MTEKQYLKKYRRMHRKYKKDYKYIAKTCKPWDYSWILDFTYTNLLEMKEFYDSKLSLASEFGHNEEHKRINIIQKALELYEDYKHKSLHFDNEDPRAEEEAIAAFFKFLGENILYLWD